MAVERTIKLFKCRRCLSRMDSAGKLHPWMDISTPSITAEDNFINAGDPLPSKVKYSLFVGRTGSNNINRPIHCRWRCRGPAELCHQPVKFTIRQKRLHASPKCRNILELSVTSRCPREVCGLWTHVRRTLNLFSDSQQFQNAMTVAAEFYGEYSMIKNCWA